MQLKELRTRPEIQTDEKSAKVLEQFALLLEELRKKSLPEEIINSINHEIDRVNVVEVPGKLFIKQVRSSQAEVLKTLEKELKLVPINHYRNTWMAVGMAAFGLPFGAALGAVLGNMAFLSIGLPIGLAVGLAVGTSLDKKVEENGNQLQFEVKH